MLVVETVSRIRREFFIKGKSIKGIVHDGYSSSCKGGLSRRL